MNKKIEMIDMQIQKIQQELSNPRLCYGTLDTQTRVSGYYRSLANFNGGKVAEVQERLLYKVG